MKYQKGTRRRALEYEKELVQYWKENDTFQKSVQNRPATDAYVFYDGPPFITGVPHHGTLLSSIIKDAVPRFWTMQGRRVERRWGWDCHGLPAENFTEKKLGITDRRDIGTKISLEEYITTCRDNMVLTGDAWESTIDRIGRWVDFKGAYRTMDKDYMESVWWAFKKLYESGKIYEGERVLMYDTKWATPLSKAEVTMDAGAYQDVTDPSVYVKFKLRDRPGTPVYMLAWTTTPWTLPANTALAVNPAETYVEVALDGAIYVVAEALAVKVFTDEKHQPLAYETLASYPGSALVGKTYEPLFTDRGANAHQIWPADYVTLEDGSGVVHLAPAYGEEDFELALKLNIPVVHVLDDYGKYTESDWLGQDVWESNKAIAKALKDDGRVFKIDYIRHSYPHNPRNGNRLMYRAHPSWFMDIAGQRQDMLGNNASVEWFPSHIKQGRFAKTIETAPDWNLSRDRFWATAMPVWKGTDSDGKEHIKVIGSYEELHELSGVTLEDYHRPWVDDITFDSDGVTYKRIDKVLDCWFESGSMPFAQFHYPFENVEKFEQNFPGDFIVEYVGQVRAWFYYMHAVSTGLFGTNSFKQVVVTGTLLGEDGRKLSKSLNNFTDPNQLMDQYSADSLRFLLMQSPVVGGEDFVVKDKDVGDVARKLSMIWNMYDFFTLYADVDSWDSGLQPGEVPTDPSADLQNPLDQWVVSRLHQLTAEVTKHMTSYDIQAALKPMLPFIDDASNWYVRRSRKRFWKTATDDASKSDKQQAYRTLHYVLTQLSLVLAPFTPFLAEELYRKLTDGESVHLLDWPTAGRVNELVVQDMAQVREAINVGLAQRAKAGIKVRQPLTSVTIYDAAGRLTKDFADIIAEELNVKQVLTQAANEAASADLDFEITPELRAEGQMREIIRNVQQARKVAGLEVDDRITLQLSTADADLQTVLDNGELTEVIQAETLATSLVDTEQEHGSVAKVDGVELTISLAKA